MPMIDADQLKPALAAWHEANEAFSTAALALRNATDRGDRAATQELYDRAQDAHEAKHDRAADVARLVARLIREAEREG